MLNAVEEDMDSMTPEEKAGVKMIQALLALHGETETIEQSLAGWRRMEMWEKGNTIAVYEALCVGGHA